MRRQPEVAGGQMPKPSKRLQEAKRDEVRNQEVWLDFD